MNQELAIAKIAEPLLVYNEKTFAHMLNHLSKQTFLALDTESDSLYRYYPRVCLIQISTIGESQDHEEPPIVDYLVDPLRLNDVSPLGLILANSAVEVIMHAAENDILELQRNFQFTFQNIFDTQLAARILGWPHAGLAAILEEQFGIISDKRMQRTNWGKRPLTPQQITYAQMDTHFLPALRAVLVDQLKAAERWDEAQDAFAMLSKLDYHQYGNHKRAFWQMKITKEIPREATAVLEALWEWRERVAQTENWPPFKILNDEVLGALAVQQPQTLEDLKKVGHLNEQQSTRYGKALLNAIADGRQRPLPAPPESKLRPEQLLDKPALNRYEALRRWRAKVAEERKVALDIVFNNSTLVELAQRLPRNQAEILEIPEIGPWKAQNYGPDLLAVLHKTPPNH